MESDEDDEETQASFCRFLDDNFKLPISAYAPGCVPKVKIKERLYNIITVRQNYLEPAGLWDSVVTHLTANFTSNSDIETLTILVVKYAYFVRCKYVHGEQ